MDRIVLAARLVTQVHAALRDLDIFIEYGSDFCHYNNIILENRSMQDVAAQFNSKNYFLNKENSFWVLGRDADDVLVHTQALKSVYLHGSFLGEYLKDFFRSFPPVGIPVDLDSSSFSMSPGAKSMCGNVMYHGDLWLTDDPKYRGTNINSLLNLLVISLTYLRWRPDYVFGFVAGTLAYRGLTVRESYLHCEPDVVNWKLSNGTNFSGHMVWNSLEDIEYVIDCGPERWLR
jgi:hypothetical protein